MIDLGNKAILIRNHEEYEKILEECRKQGCYWYWGKNCDCLDVEFPLLLLISEGKTIDIWDINPCDCEFCEASDLLGEKEMTAREFVEWMCKCFKGCNTRSCQSCVLSCFNTKFGHELCSLGYWPGNEDELLELAKTGRIIIDKKAKEELSMKESLNALIKDKSNDEIFRCITYLTNKMKEKE